MTVTTHSITQGLEVPIPFGNLLQMHNPRHFSSPIELSMYFKVSLLDGSSLKGCHLLAWLLLLSLFSGRSGTTTWQYSVHTPRTSLMDNFWQSSRYLIECHGGQLYVRQVLYKTIFPDR